MKEYEKERALSVVAALTVFAVFAVGVLAVLLGGAQGYRRLNQRDAQTYNSRTCAQYLASRLRQAPAPGAVTIESFGDGDAIQIAQQVESETYLTRIYCYDGWLMELFTGADGDFAPEDGEKVLPGADLILVCQQDLLLISVTDGSGLPLQLKLSLRGWEEMP